MHRCHVWVLKGYSSVIDLSTLTGIKLPRSGLIFMPYFILHKLQVGLNKCPSLRVLFVLLEPFSGHPWVSPDVFFVYSRIVLLEEQKNNQLWLKKQTRKWRGQATLCCYSQRVCNLEKLKGFHFCHKHILEDKASPFKPCSFTAKSNGKRCTNPAPKLPDKEKRWGGAGITLHIFCFESWDSMILLVSIHQKF